MASHGTASGATRAMSASPCRPWARFIRNSQTSPKRETQVTGHTWKTVRTSSVLPHRTRRGRVYEKPAWTVGDASDLPGIEIECRGRRERSHPRGAAWHRPLRQRVEISSLAASSLRESRNIDRDFGDTANLRLVQQGDLSRVVCERLFHHGDPTPLCPTGKIACSIPATTRPCGHRRPMPPEAGTWWRDEDYSPRPPSLHGRVHHAHAGDGAPGNPTSSSFSPTIWAGVTRRSTARRRFTRRRMSNGWRNAE